MALRARREIKFHRNRATIQLVILNNLNLCVEIKQLYMYVYQFVVLTIAT